MRGAILHGTGPAPVGYVGPCACDPDLGSHFHRHSAQVLPKRAGDYVAGGRVEGGALRPVLACGCVDHAPGWVFYTSARDDRGRHVALSGPYATHADALAALDADKAKAWDSDPRAPWYAYGTFAAEASERIKVAFGIQENQEERS